MIKITKAQNAIALFVGALVLVSCAGADVPDSRNVRIPTPVAATDRVDGVNEKPDSVMYLPLGEDMLVPSAIADEPLPNDIVGPFELRGETLAGALQLILADYDISIAFETDEGLTRKITVANLRGPLDKVVNRVCSSANLYCSYEEETLIVKDRQTFTVSLPPLGGPNNETAFMSDVGQGLSALLGPEGGSPIIDQTTRTLVYTATQRTSTMAAKYFQRLRANTAMIVFETYIWEVALNSGNSAGINWDKLLEVGKYNFSVDLAGQVAGAFTNPVSIGLPTTGDVSPNEVLNFLSQFGAVKTISQPQITVLSGATAELRVADTQNYVSEISTTLDDGQATTSVNTDTVDSGFTLTIGSSWDRSTVYADVNIELTNVVQIDNFAFSSAGNNGANTTIQLPQTTERELTTQIRIRPGDSVLIGGLVRESDNFNNDGIGFMEPVIPQSRTAQTQNLELVFLLRPKVVAYTPFAENALRDAPGTISGENNNIDTVTPISAPEKVETIPAVKTDAPDVNATGTTVAPKIAPIEEQVSVMPVAPEEPVASVVPVAPAFSVAPVAPAIVVEPQTLAVPEPLPYSPPTSPAPLPAVTSRPVSSSPLPAPLSASSGGTYEYVPLSERRSGYVSRSN